VVAYFAVLGVANGVWLARIPADKEHLHLTDGVLGLALLAAPAGLVVAAPSVALVTITLGFAPSLPLLMLGLLAFGLAGGMLDVSMNSQAVLVERGAGWSAVYLRDNLGASAGLAALAYAGCSVAMAFGRLSGDRLALHSAPSG
jgi:hypothetical protein